MRNTVEPLCQLLHYEKLDVVESACRALALIVSDSSNRALLHNIGNLQRLHELAETVSNIQPWARLALCTDDDAYAIQLQQVHPPPHVMSDMMVQSPPVMRTAKRLSPPDDWSTILRS